MDTITKSFNEVIIALVVVESDIIVGGIVGKSINASRKRLRLNGIFELEEVDKNSVLYKIKNDDGYIYVKHLGHLKDFDKSDYDYLIAMDLI